MSQAESPFEEPIKLPVEDYLDLHPFRPKDIPSVLEEYLEQSRLAGFREVRIIHGKGKGVQRNIVQSWLRKQTAVESFRDAPLEAGSWGATLVILRAEI
jgi:DNA-nicking Smr family endonuclease